MLSDFAKAEEAMLDDLLRGISDGAPALAAGDGARFQNAVAARTAPPRNSGTRPAAAPAPAASPAAPPAPDPEPDLASRLRALTDRFR